MGWRNDIDPLFYWIINVYIKSSKTVGEKEIVVFFSSKQKKEGRGEIEKKETEWKGVRERGWKAEYERCVRKKEEREGINWEKKRFERERGNK